MSEQAFVDTNILIRHLTGEPRHQAEAATAFLSGADTLFLTDLVVAEIVYVLESFYELDREDVANAVRATLGYRPVVVADSALLHRAIEVYEHDRIDFAEAYLAAAAERSGIGRVASFDRALDRVETIKRIEPGPPAT